MIRKLILAIALILPFCALSQPANAATCFWIGGAGNWDSTNTASWASTSGGGAGSCAATGGIPKNAADTAVFDGSSGSGTITVCGASSANCPSSSGNITITQITCGAFTGTLDFSVNNPAVTLGSGSGGFNCTGTGTRTLKFGSGVWTLTNGTAWNLLTTTNLSTPSGLPSSLVLAGGHTQIQFFGGALTYPSVTLNANSGNAAYYTFESGNNANDTITALTVNAPANITYRSGSTLTVTNGFSITGTAANPVLFLGDNGSNQAFNLAVGAASTCAWCMFRNVNGQTSTIAASNSFSLGVTSGTLSISNPAGGGGQAPYIGG